MFKSLFTKHPGEAGESYLAHAWFAFRTSMQLIWAGVALLLHALLPFIFVTTACDCITRLSGVLAERKAKCDASKTATPQ